MGVKAECTWGFGSDVWLVNEGHPYVNHEEIGDLNRFAHGVSRSGSIQITADEALVLAEMLIRAANLSKELDEGYEAEVVRDLRQRIPDGWLLTRVPKERAQ